MKLVIPPQIQIGAHTFNIVWSYKILDLQDARGGGIYRNELLIRLMPNRPITQTFQTFIHEAIHLTDMVFLGPNEIKEDQTQALAGGLAQFLLSLGIEPDFSQIPDEKV